MPELTATPWRRLVRSAMSSSKRDCRGPTLSRPDRSVSTTASISASEMSAWLRGMKLIFGVRWEERCCAAGRCALCRFGIILIHQDLRQHLLGLVGDFEVRPRGLDADGVLPDAAADHECQVPHLVGGQRDAVLGQQDQGHVVRHRIMERRQPRNDLLRGGAAGADQAEQDRLAQVGIGLGVGQDRPKQLDRRVVTQFFHQLGGRDGVVEAVRPGLLRRAERGVDDRHEDHVGIGGGGETLGVAHRPVRGDRLVQTHQGGDLRSDGPLGQSGRPGQADLVQQRVIVFDQRVEELGVEPGGDLQGDEGEPDFLRGVIRRVELLGPGLRGARSRKPHGDPQRQHGQLRVHLRISAELHRPRAEAVEIISQARLQEHLLHRVSLGIVRLVDFIELLGRPGLAGLEEFEPRPGDADVLRLGRLTQRVAVGELMEP